VFGFVNDHSKYEGFPERSGGASAGIWGAGERGGQPLYPLLISVEARLIFDSQGLTMHGMLSDAVASVRRELVQMPVHDSYTAAMKEMTVEAEIQRRVGALVGLPLWALGRAVDLAWLEFGSRRTVSRGGKEKQVGDYALHIQCAWRITRGDQIITGRGDIFCTPVESEEPRPDDFDWQKGNRFDRIAEALFEHESRQFIVQSVHVGEAGSLAIVLDDGYKLEVFPHDSESGEHWRFFRPFSDEPHLVFSGKGLQSE
jgi:hypothetical protein